MKSPLKGHHGWMILVGVIAAIDLTASENETLTDACARTVEKFPLLTTGAVLCTATHLIIGNHPTYHRIDPFRLIGYARHFTAGV